MNNKQLTVLQYKFILSVKYLESYLLPFIRKEKKSAREIGVDICVGCDSISFISMLSTTQ